MYTRWAKKTAPHYSYNNSVEMFYSEIIIGTYTPIN